MHYSYTCTFCHSDQNIVRYSAVSAGTPSPRLLTELARFKSPIKKLLYSPDDKWLATTTLAGAVDLWRPVSDRRHDNDRHLSLAGHAGSVRDVSFSPDSRRLATVGVEMSVCVWDVAGGGGHLLAAWYGPVSCLSFVDNDVIVVGEATGNRRCLVINQQ